MSVFEHTCRHTIARIRLETVSSIPRVGAEHGMYSSIFSDIAPFGQFKVIRACVVGILTKTKEKSIIRKNSKLMWKA